MAITAHNLNSPPAVVAEVRTPELVANRMFCEYGKEDAYAEAVNKSDFPLFSPDRRAFWEDVAALIDAMSPCELCGKPGVGFYNDVFCCEEHYG